MLKIIVNRDVELAEEAERQLVEMYKNYGKRYCPCALERNENTICPCKEFFDSKHVGECACGKYEKIEVY